MAIIRHVGSLACRKHEVSRMISIAIRLLRKQCPGIELVVAFADTGQGHHGGIYQASGFVYAGLSEKGRLFKHKTTGRILHNRAVSANGYRSHFGHIRKVPRTDECTILESTEKHRYLLPLTPGRVEEFELRLDAIANLFKAGHRIRLTIASSSFPAYLPSPGTAEPVHLATHAVVARNAIYHDPGHPSALTLPTRKA